MSIDLMRNKFDSKTFNSDFVQYTDEQKQMEKRRETEKLSRLNTEIYQKKISEMTFNEIVVEWKESIIGVMNDIINLQLHPKILFSNNRLLFIGCTVIIVIILFYFYYWLFFSSSKVIKNEHTFNISFNIPTEQRNIFSKIIDGLTKKIKESNHAN